MLEEMFYMQEQFDQKAYDKAKLNGEDVSTESHINKRVIALYSEMGEFTDELAYFWKFWKAKRHLKPVRVKEELVDIVHFLISLCITFGISADDIYMEYKKKNKENLRRTTNGY